MEKTYEGLIADISEYEVDEETGQVNTQIGNGVNMHLLPKLIKANMDKEYNAQTEESVPEKGN